MTGYQKTSNEKTKYGMFLAVAPHVQYAAVPLFSYRLWNSIITIHSSHVDWKFLHCWSWCSRSNFYGS